LSTEELTCAELVELVTDYLEGHLDAALLRRLEDHLAGCDPCVAFIHQMRTTIALSGRLRVDDLGSNAKADLLAAFRGWRPESPG
jgi:anti-sigma factor RsiW